MALPDFQGIKAEFGNMIRAEPGIAADVDIRVDVPLEHLGTLSTPFIAINLGPLTAPDEKQRINAGRGVVLVGSLNVVVGFHSIYESDGIAMCDQTWMRVVLAWLRKRKFGERVQDAHLREVDRDSAKHSSGWVASAIVVIDYEVDLML